MRFILVLAWAMAIVAAVLLSLALWPIRLLMSASSVVDDASVVVRVSPWPYFFSLPVYRRNIVPQRKTGKSPTQLLTSISESIDRVRNLAPVFSSALSQHYKLISVSWHSLVGIADASLTAIACGSLWAAKSALLASAYARWGRRSDLPEYSVTPAFDRECFHSDLDLVVELSIASFIFDPSFFFAVRHFITLGRRRRE